MTRTAWFQAAPVLASILWPGVLMLFLSCSRTADAPLDPLPATVLLHAESNVVAPGKPIDLAVEILLDRGWHTYWLNPGDAGLAPEMTWLLPAGWRHSAADLPVPQRFESQGMVSFGFADRPVFLVTVYPPVSFSADTAAIRLVIRLLLCKEACIAFSDTVGLTLPAGKQTVSSAAGETTRQLFNKARVKLPRKDTVFGQWRYTKNNRITLDIPLGEAGGSGWFETMFIPINRGLFDYSAPQEFRRLKDRRLVSLVLTPMREREPSSVTGLLVTRDGSEKNPTDAVFVRARKD